MSSFITILRFRRSTDSAVVRKDAQELIDYFSTWKPPVGTTLLSLHVALDQKCTIGLWESDSHAALAVAVAQFLPWSEIDVIPVVAVDEAIAAQIAGGLIAAS
jgi:hypothetical protein